MSNVTLNETDKLKIKCAQLELVLGQERAQAAVRAAMETRDELIKSIFTANVPDGNLEDYKFDLEAGVFALQEQGVQEVALD